MKNAIIHKRFTYVSNNGGKTWKSVSDMPDTDEVVTMSFYHNFTDPAAIRFFNNFSDTSSCRVSRSYTPIGKVVTKVTTIDPDRVKKTIDTFEFVRTEIWTAGTYADQW